jgi:hypothetical protein
MKQRGLLMNNLLWPLKGIQPQLPPPHGQFGAVRKFDIHSGLDLYAHAGTEVVCIEDCKVIDVFQFTGTNVESSWWNDTWAVMTSGASGVVLYGELQPCIDIGSELRQGDTVGRLLPVLKRDKGLPMCMLHIEHYAAGTTEICNPWYKLEEKEEKLLDPQILLSEFFV